MMRSKRLMGIWCHAGDEKNGDYNRHALLKVMATQSGESAAYHVARPLTSPECTDHSLNLFPLRRCPKASHIREYGVRMQQGSIHPLEQREAEAEAAVGVHIRSPGS